MPRFASVPLLALALAGSSACAPPKGDTTPPTDGATTAPAATDDSELTAMTLLRPDWMDKYANPDLDERSFDIGALMRDHQLDRAHAVELQNHYRDLVRAEPQGDHQAQYAEALRLAKEGVFEDGRKLDLLAKAPFIVVFDLDETLYDQSFDDPAVGEACHDFVSTDAKGKERTVKVNPGLVAIFDRIASLGGAIVLFSANVDDTCWANAAAWTVGGKPILEHPAVAGMLTNSHLLVQSKADGDPVVEPSKDLRIFDPELSRTIIVDDNPLRLFQFRNVRVLKKFQADVYCTTKDAETKQAHERGLVVVADEIEDSVRYMKDHPGVSFADAYLPYTDLGLRAVAWLRSGTKRTEREAIDHLRAHPELADEEY